MDKRYKRRSMAGAASLAIALALGASSPAAMADAADDAALAADAAAVSQATGTTVTPADAANQLEFQKFVDRVRVSHSTTFIEAVWRGSGGTNDVKVNGRTIESYEVEAASYPFNINYTSSGGTPEKEMLARQKAIMDDLTAQGKAETSVVTFDAPNSTIDVTYGAESGVEDSALEASVEEAALDDAADIVVPDAVNEVVTVRFRGSSQPMGGPEGTSYGGGNLYGAKSKTICTAGFSGRYAYDGKPTGVITAQHCYNMTKFEPTGSALTPKGGIPKDYGDMMFFQTNSDAASASFIWKAGQSRRTVVAEATVSKGTKVCKYGRTTNSGCGVVYKTGVCAGGYCGMVAIETYITQGGDSGGPWYWGQTAVGIHHGWATIGLKKRSLFTPIGNYRQASFSLLKL